MATGTLLDPPAATAAEMRGAGHGRRASSPRTMQWLLLVATSCAVVVATLTPEGTGWAWGSPLTELRWYLTGLDSSATVVQLVGNLVLLVVPAAVLITLRPALGRSRWLFAAALGTGTAMELLQWALPLGRVVSPLDAVLNAAGATAAGLLTVRAQHARHRAVV